MKTIGSATLITALLLSSPVRGQELDLSKFDKNRNGVIDAGTDEERIYVLHRDNEIFRKYDKNYNGRLDRDEIAAYERDAEGNLELARNDFRRQARQGKVVKVTPMVAAPAEKPQPTTFKTGFILRKSFEDVSIFSNPFDASEAQGAVFSWTHDREANNRSWSGKGVVAVPFVFRREFLDDEKFRTEPYIVASTIAPYLVFNRVSNPAKKQNIEDYTFGVLGETAITNILRTTHYLRVKAGVMTDFHAKAKSSSVAAEWEPVSNHFNIGVPIPIGSLPVTAQFNPKWQVIYSAESGDTQLPIYADRQQALRTGPTVSMRVKPMPIETVPAWLRRVSLLASYSLLYDTYSGRRYQFLDTGLTYNLDADGHLGLQLGYSKGDAMDTGERVHLYTLSLSSKF